MYNVVTFQNIWELNAHKLSTTFCVNRFSRQIRWMLYYLQTFSETDKLLIIFSYRTDNCLRCWAVKERERGFGHIFKNYCHWTANVIVLQHPECSGYTKAISLEFLVWWAIHSLMTDTDPCLQVIRVACQSKCFRDSSIVYHGDGNGSVPRVVWTFWLCRPSSLAYFSSREALYESFQLEVFSYFLIYHSWNIQMMPT